MSSRNFGAFSNIFIKICCILFIQFCKFGCSDEARALKLAQKITSSLRGSRCKYHMNVAWSQQYNVWCDHSNTVVNHACKRRLQSACCSCAECIISYSAVLSAMDAPISHALRYIWFYLLIYFLIILSHICLLFSHLCCIVLVLSLICS